jgi:hypothetical protein
MPSAASSTNRRMIATFNSVSKGLPWKACCASSVFQISQKAALILAEAAGSYCLG